MNGQIRISRPLPLGQASCNTVEVVSDTGGQEQFYLVEDSGASEESFWDHGGGSYLNQLSCMFP